MSHCRLVVSVLAALALSVAAGAQDGPPPAATPPAAEIDGAAAVDVVSVLLDPAEAAKLAARPQEERARIAMEQLGRLPPAQRELLVRRVRHAQTHLAENGSLLSARTVALLVLGPPLRVHVEAARAWSEEVPRIEVADVLAQLDRGTLALEGKPAGDAPQRELVKLAGALATETWAYGASGGRRRVLRFVDEDADGTFRLAKDEIVAADAAVSKAPATTPPADVFAQLGYGQPFEELPSVTKAGLAVTLSPSYFRAPEWKTFARVVLVLDPGDVELELEVAPVEYQTTASAWLRVEQAGHPIYQGEIPAGKGGLAALGRSWGAEFGLPLLPGDYAVTAVVVDGAGRGGRTTGTLSVPDMSAGLALSSVVLAGAQDAGGGPGLPKSKVGEGGALAPFQVGSYEVRPRTPPEFKRGETLAVVVQAYGAAGASVDFDLWLGGSLQGTLDTVKLEESEATEIQLVPVLEQWPDASYKIVVTATAGDGSKAQREVAFKVKG